MALEKAARNSKNVFKKATLRSSKYCFVFCPSLLFNVAVVKNSTKKNSWNEVSEMPRTHRAGLISRTSK